MIKKSRISSGSLNFMAIDCSFRFTMHFIFVAIDLFSAQLKQHQMDGCFNLIAIIGSYLLCNRCIQANEYCHIASKKKLLLFSMNTFILKNHSKGK